MITTNISNCLLEACRPSISALKKKKMCEHFMDTIKLIECWKKSVYLFLSGIVSTQASVLTKYTSHLDSIEHVEHDLICRWEIVYKHIFMGTNKSWIWATSQASENGVRTRLATTHPCNLHIQQSFRMHVAEEAWPSNTQPAMRVDAYFLPNLKHLLCLVSGMVVSGGWLPFVRESFSIAFMNLRKCLIYSGNVSKLQWPPPLTHNGSYFSFASSHRRFPWEKSTISSSVPCKTQANPLKPTRYQNAVGLHV